MEEPTVVHKDIEELLAAAEQILEGCAKWGASFLRLAMAAQKVKVMLLLKRSKEVLEKTA